MVTLQILGSITALTLTADILEAAIAQLPPEARREPAHRAQWVLSYIVQHFLGRDWFRRYALPDGDPKSYLFPNFDLPEGNKQYTIRLFFLADLLFNLQDVPGLERCLKPLRHGNIEPTMAELAIGMLLKQQGYGFRFVEPIHKQGSDYDLALTYPDGRTACADVKCKILSGTARSGRTIGKSLERARGQLPTDEPGIVFVKLPQEWLNPANQDVVFTGEMLDAVADFFRNTERVVLVVFYVFHIDHLADHARNRHAILECPNPGHRFDRNADWRLMSGEEFADPFVDRNWRSVLSFTTPPAEAGRPPVPQNG